MLFTLHLFAAKISKIELLEITQDEAEQLAGAITRVTELYDIAILDEKTMAWVQLAMVGSAVYGTRIMASVLSAKKKSNVVEMKPSFVGQQ